jgi:transposase
MTFSLRENEAEILAIWQKSPVFRLSRRAWLVSESAKGVDTKDLAKAVAMPEQRVIEVIDRYRQSGVLGVIENPRVGRARKIPEGAVKHLLQDMAYKTEGEFDVNEIALKINQDHWEQISKDLIWRQARIDGITLKRNTTKRILVEADQTLNHISGLVVTPSITIIAVIKTKNVLPLEGYLEAINPDWLKTFPKKKSMTILTSMKELASYGAFVKRGRSSKEIMLRWAQNLSRIASRDGASIQIEVCGDFQSSELMDWLKVLKANRLTEGVRFFLKQDAMSLSNKELLNAIKQLKKSSSVYIWAKKLMI